MCVAGVGVGVGVRSCVCSRCGCGCEVLLCSRCGCGCEVLCVQPVWVRGPVCELAGGESQPQETPSGCGPGSAVPGTWGA